MEETDFGKVTPEMLQNMVSDSATDKDIPDQYYAVPGIDKPKNEGNDHGDR